KTRAIPASPMVFKNDYAGPKRWTTQPDTGETNDLRIRIDPKTLDVSIIEKRDDRDRPLISTSAGLIRPIATTMPAAAAHSSREIAELVIQSQAYAAAYGLGEQFFEPNQAPASWIGLRRTPGNEFGNRLVPFHGGAIGNAQFPVLYALGR